MEWARQWLATAAIFVAWLWLPGLSEAKDLHIAAGIGEEVRVFGHVRFGKDCSPGAIPEMTIVVPPKLGQLSSKIETVTLTAPDFGRCAAGNIGPGKVVYYTAQTTGRDSFHYRMSSPGLPTTDWLVTVDVR
jgi:hypothetical protein